MIYWKTSWAAFGFIALMLTVPAKAQNGPPPHVRKAIDSVMAMLRSTDDAALETFMDEAMVPDAVGDRSERKQQLRSIRASARFLLDDVGVENDGSGPRIVLRGNGVEKQIALGLTPEGVRSLELMDPPEGPAGREGAVRNHARALERSAAQTLDSFVSEMENEHLAASFLEDANAEDLKALLFCIREAAAQAEEITMNIMNDVYVMQFSGAETFDVTFGVDLSEPFKVTSLDIGPAGSGGMD